MTTTPEQLRKQYDKSLADTVLTEEMPNGVLDPYRAYRLAKPGTGSNSVRIIQTPEGVLLAGDLTPNDNRGLLSDMGKNIAWFAGDLPGHYLCEKFLRKAWHADVAALRLRHWLKEGTDDWHTSLDIYQTNPHPRCAEDMIQYRNAISRCARELEHENMEAAELYDMLCEYGYETGDGIPGYGYDLRDVGLLTAIQSRFAKLYAELREAKDAECEAVDPT